MLGSGLRGGTTRCTMSPPVVCQAWADALAAEHTLTNPDFEGSRSLVGTCGTQLVNLLVPTDSGGPIRSRRAMFPQTASSSSALWSSPRVLRRMLIACSLTSYLRASSRADAPRVVSTSRLNSGAGINKAAAKSFADRS